MSHSRGVTQQQCVLSQLLLCSLDLLCPRPGGHFGIARSVRLSVPWRSSLGYRHTGCLQFSHRRPPEMCGLRTRPRTDVDPPRFLPASNCNRISPRRPRAVTLYSSRSLSGYQQAMASHDATALLSSRCGSCRDSAALHCRPVLIEVPHQASLHNGEREVYVLRSDNGQTWHEHPALAPNADVNDALDGCFQGQPIHLGGCKGEMARWACLPAQFGPKQVPREATWHLL